MGSQHPKEPPDFREVPALRGIPVERPDEFVLERPVRVLLAHRYRLFRDGIANLLIDSREIEIVASVGTRDELKRVAKATQPEIVIMEPLAASSGRLEVLEALCEALPETRFLIIAKKNQPEQIVQAIRIGAAGYICENESISNLIKAVRVVYRGKLWIDQLLVAQMLKQPSPEGAPLPVKLPSPPEAPATEPPVAGADETPAGPIPIVECASNDLLQEEPAGPSLLTAREREIAEYLAAGLSNKRIAAALNLSESTVKTHLVNIFRKCRVKDRLQLAIFFRELMAGS